MKEVNLKAAIIYQPDHYILESSSLNMYDLFTVETGASLDTRDSQDLCMVGGLAFRREAFQPLGPVFVKQEMNGEDALIEADVVALLLRQDFAVQSLKNAVGINSHQAGKFRTLDHLTPLAAASLSKFYGV